MQPKKKKRGFIVNNLYVNFPAYKKNGANSKLGQHIICSSVDHNETTARYNSTVRSLTQNPTFPFLPTQSRTPVYEGVFMEGNYNHRDGSVQVEEWYSYE